MSHEQEQARALMKEILQEDLLEWRVPSYKLEERFSDERCEIYLAVINKQTDEEFPIEGSGVGLVDAIFQGLCARLAPDFTSLKSIAFSAFEVKGLMSSGHRAASDAVAHVELGIRNSYGIEFTFQGESRSIGQACIEAVLEGVEYFVNAERAFIKMYRARQHYETAGRTDLVAKYTSLMAQMVTNTSYSEVIDKIKSEIA